MSASRKSSPCSLPLRARTARASSTAACAMPSAWPEIPIRPESRARIATVNPWPSAPRRFSAGTTTSSSTSSPVGEPLSPIFLNTCPTRSPGVADGTRNALTPAAFSPGPVRANTTYRPAWPTLVMKTLVPLRTYPSPVRRALACSDAASEPDAGSVSANAPSSSPEASRGSHFRFCSSVPNSRIGSLPTLVCTSTITEVEAHACASSSMQTAKASASRPAPPYSLGIRTPRSPAFRGRGDGLDGKPVVAIDLFGQRQGDALRKLTDRITERGVLGGEFKIQLRR